MAAGHSEVGPREPGRRHPKGARKRGHARRGELAGSPRTPAPRGWGAGLQEAPHRKPPLWQQVGCWRLADRATRSTCSGRGCAAEADEPDAKVMHVLAVASPRARLSAARACVATRWGGSEWHPQVTARTRGACHSDSPSTAAPITTTTRKWLPRAEGSSRRNTGQHRITATCRGEGRDKRPQRRGEGRASESGRRGQAGRNQDAQSEPTRPLAKLEREAQSGELEGGTKTHTENRELKTETDGKKRGERGRGRSTGRARGATCGRVVGGARDCRARALPPNLTRNSKNESTQETTPVTSHI